MKADLGPLFPPRMAPNTYAPWNHLKLPLPAWVFLLTATAAWGEISVVVEHNDNQHAAPYFTFQHISAPSGSDAATHARFMLLEGESDSNGDGLSALHDGKVPSGPDQPDANFFFNAGTEGGRILADLGGALELEQVNTYSWHPGARGPQVYQLYGSDGQTDRFQLRPGHETDPAQCGWTPLARVDTRPKEGEGGGQYGVSIRASAGILGTYRYLLFDVSRTEAEDAFGNTFYSEIDVVAKGNAVAAVPAEPEIGSPATPFTVRSTDGNCEITIKTSDAPDLKEWAEQKLGPVLAAWYPKLVAMLSSEGYTAPKQFSVTLSPGRGVAATGGTRITANSTWLKSELDREALGALVHEEVHVVQQYRGRRGNPDYKSPPGWLVEGIPDYIRWFLYEPQSHGADVAWLRTRRNVSLNYDARYRISANFLNYVVEHYDPKKELITRVNAACRQGKYTDDLWKASTGKTLIELNEEWKAAMEKQLHLAAGSGAADTTTNSSSPR
jgi:hypothetical protein